MSLGWPRESFTYDGCCTHFSINEQIVGRTENMPADEINRIDAERKIVKQRLYVANTGPGVYAANKRAYGQPPPPPPREEQRYKYTVCNLTFRSNGKLLEHEKRPILLRDCYDARTLAQNLGTFQSQDWNEQINFVQFHMLDMWWTKIYK
jgi:hypothetical protein